MRSRFKDVVFSLVVLGFFGLFLEVACRVMVYLDDGGILDIAQEDADAIPTDRSVGLRHLIRRSHNHQVIYELKPHLAVRFLDREVTTNSVGFRDRDYEFEKDVTTTRILGIGDSTMFGWGVADGEEYLSLLEEKLNGLEADQS